MVDTIKAIQRQVIVKLEAGEDVSELTRRLAQERAKIAAATEIEELKKIANERQAMKEVAESVMSKRDRQSLAIDQFLELVESMVSQLRLLLPQMAELAKTQLPDYLGGTGECYLYSDIGQVAASVRGIPQGYLPADFGVPFLEMKGGQVDSQGKAAEAYNYFMAAIGILSSFTKGIITLPLRPAEGLMAIDDEPDTIEANCLVCQHPDVEAINADILAGMSLRDTSAKYGISKSTVARHKAHMEA
jgi:hypothetical protein